MSAIRIRKTLDSDTLYLPELRPLIGRTVEIVVEEAVPFPEGAVARGELLTAPPPPGSPARDVLAWIAANRVGILPPGTPDSADLLREDRER